MPSPYASSPADTRGRRVPEADSTFRTCYARDRDRIIHSSAFRRLKHKTQVFVEHEGDYYRTRLTHTLEVAQVARTLAVALGLDEDLTEAVALAHDLGHPPFGHTGEDALDRLMAPYGGFDHNAQALRIVTRLERHYAAFDGLNLTWETLEGIAKHNGPVAEPSWALLAYDGVRGLELDTFASAEAQAAAISDDVAYTHHDLQDGLRAGLFDESDLSELPILGDAFAETDREWPDLGPVRRQHEALRRVFGALVEDVLATSRRLISEVDPQSPRDVRLAGHALIRFSGSMWSDLRQIRDFLFSRVYRAPSVMEMRENVSRVVAELFPLYMTSPELLPEGWQGETDDEMRLARIVSDYISGMTDRFALSEHARLLGGETTGG